MWRLLRRPIAGRIACDSEGVSRALRMVPEIGELGSRTLNFDDLAGIIDKGKHEGYEKEVKKDMIIIDTSELRGKKRRRKVAITPLNATKSPKAVPKTPRVDKQTPYLE